MDAVRDNRYHRLIQVTQLQSQNPIFKTQLLVGHHLYQDALLRAVAAGGQSGQASGLTGPAWAFTEGGPAGLLTAVRLLEFI